MKRLPGYGLITMFILLASCGNTVKGGDSEDTDSSTSGSDSTSEGSDDTATADSESNSDISTDTETETATESDTESDTTVGPDPCQPCIDSNRVCVESGGKVNCTACLEDFYENSEYFCVAKKYRGESCDLAEFNNEDCLSGFCVDGVCCDKACDGLCESCTVSAFYEGTCTPVFAGEDPDTECDDDGAASCAQNGFCDGDRACQLYPASTQCQDPSCSSNVSIAAAFCDGLGTCDTTDLLQTNCTPYSCDASSGLCKGGTCGAANPCFSGYYCTGEGGNCEPQKVNGSICTADNQCITGDCTLDDFGSSGVSYCIPSSPAYCAKEGFWHPASTSFCTTAGGTTYKNCTPDTWGTAINCPNVSVRSCIPASYSNSAGYLDRDSCADSVSGAVCETDTTCGICGTKRTVAFSTALLAPTYTITSVYTFGTTACRTNCLGKFDFPTDSYCGDPSAGTAKCFGAYERGALVGVCLPADLATGASCYISGQCTSGTCSAGKCILIKL